jgi:hypothetical protein
MKRMKNRNLIVILAVTNILVVVVFMIIYTVISYPHIGHDYRLFLPRILDTYLHYRVNGFSIQWYSPSFGGGLPAYPNPLQIQFSLPQLFTGFVDPMKAILASAAIYIGIGFLFTFLFLRKVLRLTPFSAILGAGFFIANGFMLEHLVVGHVNFLTFPLIIVPIYALLNPGLPKWLAAIFISLTVAAITYSGGVYIGVICVFTALLILPLVYFIKPDLFSWHRIVLVLLLSGLLSILLCGSKFYASAAYMHFFPRTMHDNYSVKWTTSLLGMLYQLTGTMNVLPVYRIIGKTYLPFIARFQNWTGTQYGFWELDTSLTPGVFLLLGIGSWLFVFRKRHLDKKKLAQKCIAAVCLTFALLLITSFATTKGIFYSQLRLLPVLESLHANTRFTASFTLPLAMLAAKAFDEWTKNWKSTRNILVVYAILNLVSLASLWSYYWLPLDIQNRAMDLPVIVRTWKQISAGMIFPVKRIVPDMNDYEVLMFQSSNVTHHYETLFGDNNELLKTLVHPGSVFDIQDGYYNMTDPTSLVFPQSVNSTLFERIPVSDYKKLVDFVNRRQPDWKLPLVQIILDWAAGITILLETAAILVYFIGRRIPFLMNHRFLPFLRDTHS